MTITAPPSPPAPPRRAERLLRWSLSLDDRQPQLGDLQEEFATLSERSPAAARRWYWRQALTSVVPNVLRRIRHGWHLISRIADEKDLRSRLWRRWLGVALAVAGVALGVGLSIRRSNWNLAREGVPFVAVGLLLTISGFYQALTPGRPSRRMRLLQISSYLVTAAMFTKEAGHSSWFKEVTWVYPIFLLQAVVWFWPRATWPFHRALSVTEYSLRSPLFMFRQYGSQNYELITVQNVPLAMSAPIVGPAAPVSVPPESQIDGVVPMSETSSRTFAATESLRLFVVVNAAPDELEAAVEIRRASTGRLLGTIPGAIGPAVPAMPPTHKFRLDSDDEPLVPALIRMSEVNAVVSLAGLAPDNYTLRIVAHHPEGSSFERVGITIRPELARR